MAEERLWCTACGTVTRDLICDCNIWQNDASREPQFVNYADAMQKEARELIQEVHRLRQGIQDYLDGNYDNPRQHRPHPCAHGQLWYQGCDQCDDEHFSRLLGDVIPDPVGGSGTP